MGSNYVDDLVDDDEIPELTPEDFSHMVPFSELPPTLQHSLREVQRGYVTIRTDEETVPIQVSKSIVDSFRATGEDWQARMDQALRDWLERPKAS